MEYEMEGIYREIVELYPDDFRSYLGLGSFLRQNGRYDEAKKELERAADKATEKEDITEINKLMKPMIYKQRIRRGVMGYHINVIAKLLRNIHLTEPTKARLLDVGCGTGLRTLKLADASGISRKNIIGLDIDDGSIASAKRFFKVHKVDFEAEGIPLANESVDLVICNQTLEHTRNMTGLLNEMSRVLKGNGYMLIGVPNLGSLHNRLLLLFGKQPTAIDIFHGHWKGFTVPSLRNLLTNRNKLWIRSTNGDVKTVEFASSLKIVGFAGSGFYPLPTYISRYVSKAFPSFSVLMFFLLQKVDNDPVSV